MTEFERELRLALGRQDPPEGFASRVMARIGSKAAPGWRAWIGAGIAACFILSAGGFEYRQYRGRKAGQELLLALEIAGSKLNIAQQKISELNRRTIHE